MSHPIQAPAPAAREASPITQPTTLVQTQQEGPDVRTATVLEAGRSTTVIARQEDDESNLDSESECSTSLSLPTVEEAGDTTGEAHDATEEVGNTTGDPAATVVATRCVMSFLRPQPGLCNSRITNDDRHYISNFFGRNKSCSTNIPDDFYQVLCRKCMQGMKYRIKSGTGATELQFQVAAIKHALQNMAASGRWVLVEVQFTKAEYDRRQNPQKYEEDIMRFNEDVMRAREKAKQKGEKVRRRNTKKPLTPVPDWLAELVVRSDDNEAQDYTTVHSRSPTRWSFEDMIALVDMIGENCEVLPNIECLPITQGELDQVRVTDALQYRHEVRIEHRLLVQDVARAESALKNEPDNEGLQENLQTFQNALADMDDRLTDADQELEKAMAIAEASRHTLPPKRIQLKRPGAMGKGSKTGAKKGKKATKKGRSAHKEPDDIQPELTDPDDGEGAGAETPPADQEMADPPSPSPSPPPGWKGKGKAVAVSHPGTATSKGTAWPNTQNSSATETKTSPTPHFQRLAPSATSSSTISLPITPNRPTSSITPTTPISTTRSASRRLLLTAVHGRERHEQGARQPAQTQTAGQKRKAPKEDEQRGSPVGKVTKR